MRSARMRLPLTFHETIFTVMSSCSTNFGRYVLSWRATQSWLSASCRLEEDEGVEEGEEGAGEGGDSWSWCWDTSVSAITGLYRMNYSCAHFLNPVALGLDEARQGSDDGRITVQGSQPTWRP